MTNLFGEEKYLAQNEADLAEYILRTNPFAKENPAIFNEAWLSYVLDMEFTPQQKSKLAHFNLVSGTRRRQELQAENPIYRPSVPELRRRAYLSRGEQFKS